MEPGEPGNAGKGMRRRTFLELAAVSSASLSGCQLLEPGGAGSDGITHLEPEAEAEVYGHPDIGVTEPPPELGVNVGHTGEKRPDLNGEVWATVQVRDGEQYSSILRTKFHGEKIPEDGGKPVSCYTDVLTSPEREEAVANIQDTVIAALLYKVDESSVTSYAEESISEIYQETRGPEGKYRFKGWNHEVE